MACSANPATGAPAPGTCTHVVLQRSGARPLHVTGTLLACLDDGAGPIWSRIRLALYRCDGGDHVVEIRCEHGGGHAAIRPWCHAARCPSLVAAVRALETACPAPERHGNAALPIRLPEALAQARHEAAQDHAFRHAVGVFLHALATREQTHWPR